MTDSHALAPYDDGEDLSEDLPEITAASPHSRGVALTLCVLLGIFGGHRFYAGKIRSGLLQLLTLGGLTLWWLYDLVLVVAGEFTDAAGRRIRNWQPGPVAPPGSAEVRKVALLTREMELLRGQVSELNERLDFAERMLTQQRERGRLNAERGTGNAER